MYTLSILLFQIMSIKIETYWNVNLFHIPSQLDKTCIKIETYWNVNKINLLIRDEPDKIKIETYWNVNQLHAHNGVCFACD